MCIIDGKVNTISNTEILVGKLPSNKHQFTIYSNNINIDGLINNKNIGMILPFPLGIRSLSSGVSCTHSYNRL